MTNLLLTLYVTTDGRLINKFEANKHFSLGQNYGFYKSRIKSHQLILKLLLK